MQSTHTGMRLQSVTIKWQLKKVTKWQLGEDQTTAFQSITFHRLSLRNVSPFSPPPPIRPNSNYQQSREMQLSLITTIINYWCWRPHYHQFINNIFQLFSPTLIMGSSFAPITHEVVLIKAAIMNYH